MRRLLAAGGKQAAGAWRARLAACIGLLATTPLIYQERPDVAAGYRAAPVGRYHAWYVVNAIGVRVQRILPQAANVTLAKLEGDPRP
jgi:plasmid stabilization system protein ParE